MNREELKHLNAIVDRLIGSNKQMLDDAEKRHRQAVALLHNQEDTMRSQMQAIRDAVDAYSQVIYRHTFYGGILWRIETIKRWWNRKRLLSQQPKLKKLEAESA